MFLRLKRGKLGVRKLSGEIVFKVEDTALYDGGGSYEKAATRGYKMASRASAEHTLRWISSCVSDFLVKV